MRRECHILDHIRKGYLPVLAIRIVHGWFAEPEGFEVRVQWVSSWRLLGQDSPPWYDPFEEIPF